MAKCAVLVPGTMEGLFEGAANLLESRGYHPQFLGPIVDEDIDIGLAHVDNDVCVAAIACIGQYMRYFQQHPFENTAVLSPELCRDCRSVSMPAVLRTALSRAGLGGIEIVEFSSAETHQASKTVTNGTASLGNRPVVGLFGNLPVLTTPLFKKVVQEHLEEAGCHVVTPPLELLADERDFMTPTADWFNKQGIETVICILPFGCLGGHVFARGQLRRLREQFPRVEITVLDYDPSASDINLVNRTELVIQSAKERV